MSIHRAFAEVLARQAGTIIQKNFHLNMGKTWKEDNSPLTITDTMINNLVVRAVAEEFPDHAVLAEEGNLDKKGAEYVWVCDPLDGTIPFSHGVPTCVFSLALVHNGVPIVGVIFDPFTKRLFSAEKNGGAFLNAVRIHVSKQSHLEQGVISIGYASHHINLRDVMHELVVRKAIPVNFASNVYAGSLVAAGEFIAAVFSGKLPWDVASLKIIVEEAGGRVTDLNGNEQRYDREINGAIISNGYVHEQLVELFHTHTKINQIPLTSPYDFYLP